MSYESLLAVSQRLTTSMEALAAIIAELRLRQTGVPGDPRVRALLKDVIDKIEPGLLDGLTKEQEMLALSSNNALFRQALDLIAEPGRAPGWSYDDPDILQAYGQMSRRVIHAIDALAPQLPAFEEVLRRPGTFLDVGTGVGWLAIEAARRWPALKVVGIDPWEPSVALARQNLEDENMADRIELRTQRLEELADRGAFTLAWLAGPFLPADVIPVALKRILSALRPGGWLIFGLFNSPPDPLGQAVTALRVVRVGGHPWNNAEVEDQLRTAGFTPIKTFTPPHLVRFTVGQRPL